MTASRRHSLKPVVVEVRPDNVPCLLSPSTPATPNAKKVSFAPAGDKVSRPLTSIEAWSLYHFETHARQCRQCASPLDVYRRGDRLCQAGHWLAEDVACHVYHKGGEIYSTKKEDSRLVRVEIPHDYTHLRSLLKGMDRTLQSHRTVPVLNYDRAYPVSARKSYKPEAERATVIIEPASSTSRRRTHHKQSRHSTVVPDNDVEEAPVVVKAPLPSRRGTLYDKDMQRKEKNYRVEIREPSDRKEQRRYRDDDDDNGRRGRGIYYYD